MSPRKREYYYPVVSPFSPPPATISEAQETVWTRRECSNGELGDFVRICEYPKAHLWGEELRPRIEKWEFGMKFPYRAAVLALIAENLPGVGDNERAWLAEKLVKSGPLFRGVLRDIINFSPDCEARREAQRRLDTGEYIQSDQ